jgi:hypothetical protein
MEVDMFARSVSMRLKPNTAAEFTRRMDREIIPLLRKQKGFQDEITLISAGGNEALGISLWEQKENLEEYQREIYPAVLRALAKVLEGTPQVQTSEVVSSTLHKLAAPVAPARSRQVFVG